MHRKEVTHSNGSYEEKSGRRTWLTKWDKVKAHGTLIDWCTGREWPVNCMTVISAWRRSDMLFQILSVRLNYYIPRWRQEVSELESRRVRDEMWLRKPALTRKLSHRASSWASGERERHTAMSGGDGEVNTLQSLFSLQLPLTRKPYNKVRDIFFKEVFARLLFIASVCIQHIYVLCVCIVNHGHGYATEASTQKIINNKSDSRTPKQK